MNTLIELYYRKSFWQAAWDNIVLLGAVFGALFLWASAATMIINSSQGTMQATEAVVFIPATFFLCFAVSWFIQKDLEKRKNLKELELEQIVLSYAAIQEGRALSIPEVSLNCGLRTSKATNILNKMSSDGICKVNVDCEGKVVYSFSSFHTQEFENALLEHESDNSAEI